MNNKQLAESKDIIIDSNRCFRCAYYMGDLTCLAFAKRIPTVILTGKNVHTKPLPKQGNKIVFRRGRLSDLGPEMLLIS